MINRHLRRAASHLPEVPTDSILESISDGVFTVNDAWTITSFNRAAEEITGIPRREAIGRRCSDVFRASMCESECALRRTIETGKAIVNRAGYIVDATGRRIPVSVSTAVLRDGVGRVVGGAETFRDLSLIEELRRELAGGFEIGEIVSRSVAMRRVLEALPQIAESDCTVLLQGETGTGKELVARALHDLGSRRRGPFVAVNCGALPDTLLESELFGFEAGAFTGASRSKPGRFAMAERGTLFLDEMGEVSPALQVRLLRVLQERTYEPLGGTRTRRADVRVVAATNKDLAALVGEGAFRRDLYYRIKVVKLELPPLRKRREDIPLLIDRFVRAFNAAQGKNLEGVTADALAVLMAHDYPGNVRELQNAIEHAFVLCSEGRIGMQHLPVELVPGTPPLARAPRIREAVEAVEAEAIRSALERNRYNRTAAARALGIHKTTLFRRLKRMGLVLPDEDGRTRSTPRP